jgi:hypothetical protein
MNTPTPEQIAVKIAEIANDSDESNVQDFTIGDTKFYVEIKVEGYDKLITNETRNSPAEYETYTNVSIERLQIYNETGDDADDVTDEFKDEIETLVNKLLK